MRPHLGDIYAVIQYQPFVQLQVKYYNVLIPFCIKNH